MGGSLPFPASVGVRATARQSWLSTNPYHPAHTHHGTSPPCLARRAALTPRRATTQVSPAPPRPQPSPELSAAHARRVQGGLRAVRQEGHGRGPARGARRPAARARPEPDAGGGRGHRGRRAARRCVAPSPVCAGVLTAGASGLQDVPGPPEQAGRLQARGDARCAERVPGRAVADRPQTSSSAASRCSTRRATGSSARASCATCSRSSARR